MYNWYGCNSKINYICTSRHKPGGSYKSAPEDVQGVSEWNMLVSSVDVPEEKEKRRKEVFPQDCQKAFEMGGRFVKRQKALEAQKEK